MSDDATRVAVQLFVDGAPISALVPGTEDAIRAELREGRAASAQFAAILRVWDAALDLLGELAMKARQEGQVRLEEWHPDTWIHAYTIGEGEALLYLSERFAMVANALKVAELRSAGDE